MGKVRIVGGGEKGQYSVEVLHNRDRIDAEIGFLAGQIAEMIARRDELQAEYDEAVIARNVAAAAVDEKVAAYIAGGSEGVLSVEAELIALAQASARVQTIDVDLAMVKGRLLQAEKRHEALDNIPKEEIQPAWCADFTEDLEGEVRSVEVPDEGREFLLIHPGYNDGHVYDQARDGQLFWREGQTGYQAYFNAAILPGVQRWHPQYRFATIEALDKEAHTATIAYASMDSSAQGLLITDPLAKRTDVPIEYMQCDSAVFEVDDQVLVELQERDWQQPRIIGFRDNPRQCYIIMAYTMGVQMTHDAYIDPNPAGYDAVPPPTIDPETGFRVGIFRDRGVSRVDARLFGGDGLTFLYDNEFEEVIDATKISELPDFAAWAVFDLPQITKGGFDVPTETFTRNLPTPPGWTDTVDVPVIGTKQVTDPTTGASGLYPLNKPPDSFVLTEQEIDVTFRQYRASSFQFYSTGTQGQVHYSSDVDVNNAVGTVEVKLELADFPEFITYNGTTYQRQVFVNYVPFDFDNDRGQDDEWWLDRICIRYDAYVPPE